jgi:hypothetical protein
LSNFPHPLLFISTLDFDLCVLCSGDEGHSTENVDEADAAATEASKVVTSSEMVKEVALDVVTEKTTPVPKKLKKTNADKGIAISDNPSGPPMDDVKFLRLPPYVIISFSFTKFCTYGFSFFSR